MRQSLKLRNYKIAKLQNSQRGYMLITLVLALALITIALLTVLPDIGQQIRRDREDEMRHRGTAYMRAIQHFYKKFGRYPTKIEDLESTNNVRFLRKRYTDPINRDPATGKERDFKLLHQTDISLNNGPVLGRRLGRAGSRAKLDCRDKADSAGRRVGWAGLAALAASERNRVGFNRVGFNKRVARARRLPRPVVPPTHLRAALLRAALLPAMLRMREGARIRLDRRLLVPVQVPVPAPA